MSMYFRVFLYQHKLSITSRDSEFPALSNSLMAPKLLQQLRFLPLFLVLCLLFIIYIDSLSAIAYILQLPYIVLSF